MGTIKAKITDFGTLSKSRTKYSTRAKVAKSTFRPS